MHSADVSFDWDMVIADTADVATSDGDEGLEIQVINTCSFRLRPFIAIFAPYHIFAIFFIYHSTAFEIIQKLPYHIRLTALLCSNSLSQLCLFIATLISY